MEFYLEFFLWKSDDVIYNIFTSFPYNPEILGLFIFRFSQKHTIVNKKIQGKQ